MFQHVGAQWRAAAFLVASVVLAAIAPAALGSDEVDRSEALRNKVNAAGIQRHLVEWQDAADDNGGHRFAGLEGHDRSAEYVYNKLAAAGYSPTYHTFDYDAFIELSASVLEQVSPNATTYVNGNDFRIMSYSGSGDVTANLATPSGAQTGCAAADFAGFVAGAIALVVRGACTFRIKTDNATAAGASAILIYNNIPGLLNGTLGATGLSAIPSLGLTQSLGQSLAAQLGSGPVTMHVKTDTDAETLTTSNVLAELRGRSSDVILVGAHLDSVNAGPGINDNGSGSGAILEIALQMRKVNRNPWNTVRFAWWSAEESGLIGSTRYAESLSAEQLGRIDLNLNFDMVASPNFVRFVYDGDNSAFPAGVNGVQAGPAGSGEIERVFHHYFAEQGLASAETPFNGRSDYGPFITRGIPAGGLFTGAEGIKTAAQAITYGGTAGVAYDPCYHAACDTLANVNNTALNQMSDAIAHSVVHFAARHFDVNPLLAVSASGDGSGDSGGLHPPHDEPVEE